MGATSNTAASAALVLEAATEALQGQSLHDSFLLSQSLIVWVATRALKGSWHGLQVAKLLLNISKQSGQHQHTLLRLAIVGLESLAQATPKHQQSTEEEFAAKYAFLQSTADRAKFLDFATTVMLYQPAALLPRVMPTANQSPAEASLLLKTHMLHCAVPKWYQLSQQKEHSCLWHMLVDCTTLLHGIETAPHEL